MSKVEEFYSKIQKESDGNVPWNELDRHTQDTFIKAISIILQIANLRK
jgi:hypothetical protein